MATTPHDHHNQGEQDRAENRGYDPPHGLLENAFTWSRESCEKLAEDNGAYNAGWSNTDSQSKK